MLLWGYHPGHRMGGLSGSLQPDDERDAELNAR